MMFLWSNARATERPALCNRRKTLMKKVVAILLLVSFGALILVIAGCGGGSTSSEAPADVVKQFLDANKAKNVDGLFGTLSKASQKSLNKADLKKAASSAPTVSYTYALAKPSVKGSNATVVASITEGQTKSDVTFYLVQEGGAWKIDLQKSLGGSQAQTPSQSAVQSGVQPSP